MVRSPWPVPPTFAGATHPARCHPPSPFAGATHLHGATHRCRCLAPNSASEPDVRFLSVGRDRPTPGAGGSPARLRAGLCLRRLADCPRGSLTTLPATADRSNRLSGATHQLQCHAPPRFHPPLPVRLRAGLCLRRLADCPRGSLTTRNASARCHPPFAVPPTVEFQHGAWHLIRRASRMCSFCPSDSSTNEFDSGWSRTGSLSYSAEFER